MPSLFLDLGFVVTGLSRVPSCLKPDLLSSLKSGWGQTYKQTVSIRARMAKTPQIAANSEITEVYVTPEGKVFSYVVTRNSYGLAVSGRLIYHYRAGREELEELLELCLETELA